MNLLAQSGNHLVATGTIGGRQLLIATQDGLLSRYRTLGLTI